MDLGLEQKVCVVTGSSAGIGRAVASMLAGEGARVVTSSRGREGPDVGEALHVAADLARPGGPEAVVEAALAAFGRVDCLVNNVGWVEIRKVEDITDEIWEQSFQSNLMSAARAIRAVVPGMLEQGGGSIVNVSSTAGKRPSQSMPDYSVMKAALLSLSRLVADRYAKDGIRSNAVAPGPTATPSWLAEGGLADQQPGSKDEVLAKVGAGRPLGRLAEPEEIAAVVVFLCSERSSNVTGAAWGVDGGSVPVII